MAHLIISGNKKYLYLLIIDNIKWPDSLEGIIFRDEFNQPIEHVNFPDSLKSIDFGDSFN